MRATSHTIVSFEAAPEPGCVELHLIHESGTEARILLPPDEVKRLMHEFAHACVTALCTFSKDALETEQINQLKAMLAARK